MDCIKHLVKDGSASKVIKKRNILIEWIFTKLCFELQNQDINLYEEFMKTHILCISEMLKEFNNKLTVTIVGLSNEELGIKLSYFYQVFHSSSLFSLCYLASYFLEQINKKQYDGVLHDTLSDELKTLSTK